jgi:large subunit ribosomal protein L15
MAKTKTETKKKTVHKPAAKPAGKPAAKKAAAPKAPATRPQPQPKARRAAAPAVQLPPGTGVHSLRPASGATHSRKRVGRGPGSGHGKTAGRGSKGQKSRSGYSHMRGFEGGQMPLHRRLPKRGFTNIFRRPYDPVNLSNLGRFDAGQEVTPEILHSHGMTGKGALVKILGGGEISKALVVRAHKFSASAKEKIEKAGGRCEIVVQEKVAQ